MDADQTGALRERVLAAVDAYAREEGINCSPRQGYVLYCSRQPIEVFVIDAGAALDVCYWSRGARFESGKFEERMQRLAARVDAALGKAVTRTVPVHPQCFPAEKLP
jgi:hypothetical protein